MIYDVIIIWAWRAWLYTAINADKNLNKLILEKNTKPWIKVLLSWWERANLSNIDIEPLRDYFSQNKKALLSIFSKHNNFDAVDFFSKNWLDIVKEDRWRLILSSWDSKELLNFLLDKRYKNNTTIRTWIDVKSLQKIDDIFIVSSLNWELYKTKKVVVSSWWKSFSHVWTIWDWYEFAKSFWHSIITPLRWLCWLVSVNDFSEVSWVSCDLNMEIFDMGKSIYIEKWPLLFTHFWISWPIVFNWRVAISEKINFLKIDEKDFFKNNLKIILTFDLSNTPKRLIKFFSLSEEKKYVEIYFQDYRTRKEAKITSWWININELTNSLESKKVSGLYFCWEVLDFTWKTWWFNLQLAWSTAYVVAKSL